VRPAELLLQDASLKLEKNPVGARASVTEALKQSPDDARLLRLAVNTYMIQKLPGQATQFLRDYAAGRPKSAPVQLFLAQWLLSTGGNRAQVRAALDAAHAADPDNASAELMLAQLDLTERRYDQARQTLNALVARSPSSTAPRVLLGATALEQGNPGQAIDEWRKVIEIEPNNVLALNNLAYTLADTNQPDEALKYAQRAAELAPDSPAVEDTLGWIFYRKGMHSMAVKHLESAVAGGGTARRQAHLALAYLKMGDTTRGKSALDKARQLDPGLPELKLATKMMDEVSNGAR
jgi:predicted Zn-dependent protease